MGTSYSSANNVEVENNKGDASNSEASGSFPSVNTHSGSNSFKAPSLSEITKAGASQPAWWRNFERSDLPNPGAYEELNQEASIILRPNLIDGMQFNLNAPMSESFAMGSSMEMGCNDRPSQFAFNAHYYTNRIVMISRSTPSDGRVNGRIFLNHTPALTSKIIADVGPQPDSSKFSWDLDYRGSDYSSQLKVASGGIMAVSYLQSITPSLALGGEGFHQNKSGFSAITLAGKYKLAQGTASMSVSSFGPIIASYVHRVTPKVAFASELFLDSRTRDSHLTVGYRFDLKSAVVIGNIDSTGRVAATLEERINPALSLILSGELFHQKEEYKFGFGVNIGGS